DDALLPEKTLASARRVLAPKIAGLHALETAVGDRPLERFHVFSSTSALACPAGQVDYAAANAYCDAWARQRAAEGKPGTAIAWGAWREVGMAAEIAAGERDPGAEVIPFRHPAKHAWLDTEAVDTAGVRRYRTAFATASHWLVDEHRIKDGTALIPGAGYLELLRAAWQEGGASAPCEIADVDFLSPFVVPDASPRTLEIVLEPKDTGAFDVSVRSRVPAADGSLRDEEHVAGRVRPLEGTAPAIDLEAVRRRCDGETETFDRAPEQAHLAFGPRWDNLRKRSRGDGEALLSLALPDAYLEDLAHHPLHPSLLDIGTAGAQSLIPGFDPEETFYVPIGVGRLRAWAPLEPSMQSHVRYRPEDAADGEFAVFDVTFYGEDGRVLAEVERFTMKRIEGESTLSAGHRETPAEARGSSELAELLEDAIRPVEGADAWLRLAAHAEGPHWIATPHEIGATLDALRRIASGGPAKQELPEIDVSAAREALAAHPAVADVEILPRMPRPGQIRLVAYVVRDDDHDATVSELRRHVKAAVPKDQVPASFEDVDDIPRDEDGRPRADALPDPFADDESFVAPRSPAEHIVGDIWKEILGVEAVSVYDNFFDIGGHSLLSMRVVNKVDKKTGVRLNQAIMVLQTLEQIAAEVEKQGGAPSADAAADATIEAGVEGGDAAVSTGPDSAETTAEDTGLFGRLRRSVFKG
ncbi:MAG: polyketide synthase dehydratase domain-containing protein, partial [Planctomycetota bacterium]|nr:polyketide synthase dehydratase domain-containing protein [Planctomycetota bacterium]